MKSSLLAPLLFFSTAWAQGVSTTANITVNQLKDSNLATKSNGTGLDLSNNYLTVSFFSVATDITGGPAILRLLVLNEQKGASSNQNVPDGKVATEGVLCMAQYDDGLAIDPIYRSCNDSSTIGDRYLWGISNISSNADSEIISIGWKKLSLVITHAMRFKDRNTTWYLTGYLNITQDMVTACTGSIYPSRTMNSQPQTQCSYGLVNLPVQVPITNVYVKNEVGIEGVAGNSTRGP